jgi:Protein of unknown function (DUF3631)
LQQRLSDWVEKVKPEFKNKTPLFPESLNDRQKDGARSLLLIADIAGGQWPTRGRKVLCELWGQHTADDAEFRVQLLSDIRTVFEDAATDKFSSSELAQRLAGIETSPWAEWNKGKELNQNGLAKLLKDLGK